ncbi:MAG: dihydropteroate synthase [Gammaproteobacteria bacterium]|nr:MAG: dihydropteroate synthase [Gammaproteobacteria bacterium]
MVIDCAGRSLVLDQPVVMGVLNVTPDSFSDGGRFIAADIAVERGIEMVADGAAILDIGGESTRPGAELISIQQELDRVLPVFEELVQAIDVPISIDTRHPEVMLAATAAGAGMINDVNALRAPTALAVAVESGAAVCLMHMQATPQTMQDAPCYADPVLEIVQFLRERIAACEAAGLSCAKIVVDPGFGFGKTLSHNLQLLGHLDQFIELGVPVLVGLSRKKMFGDILQKPIDQRLCGSLAGAVIAAERGARIIRCHDVGETVDVLKVWSAMAQQVSEIN